MGMCRLACCLTLWASVAAAVEVTSLDDTGPGSLRQVVADAPVDAVITFAAGVRGVITLSSAPLVLRRTVVLDGPGAGQLTLSGGSAGRVVDVAAGVATCRGLTIADGLAPPAERGGGGIQVASGASLVLERCTVTNNASPGNGGGLAAWLGSQLTVRECVFTDNRANGFGGGIFLVGGGAVSDSTFRANSAGTAGGLWNEDQALSVTGCTFVGNVGVGLVAKYGPVQVRNCTFVGHTYSAVAHAVVDQPGQSMLLANCTLTGNDRGVFTTATRTVGLVSCIVAGNRLADTVGSIDDQGFNLVGVDPLLSPLGDFGGPTLTCVPLPGSPALDAGHSGTSTKDQRGQPRPFDDPSVPNAPGGDGADIGAVERVAWLAIMDTEADEGQTAAFTVTLTPAQPSPVTVAWATADRQATAPADYTAASGTLTFAPGQTSATIMIALTDDAIAELAETFAVELRQPSGATITRAVGLATISDDDAWLLGWNPTSLVVPEGGSRTAQLALGRRPPGPVTVHLRRLVGDPDLTATPASLTFTPTDWRTPRVVTVSAAPDLDATWSTAVFRASATGWQSADLTAREADDDTRVVVKPTSLLVPEGGSATFTVALAGQPSGDKVVSVWRRSGDTDLRVLSGARLTFTPTNWRVPQTVTLGAAHDDDTSWGVAIFRVSVPGWQHTDVTAREADDDGRVLASPSAVQVPEGGSASFGVRLAGRPSATTLVLVESLGGDPDLTLRSGAILFFTPTNWRVPQTVTVVAAPDDDETNGSTVFRARALGWADATVTAYEGEAGKVLGVTTSPAAQGSVGQQVLITAAALGLERPQYKLWLIGPHDGTTVTWRAHAAYASTPAFAFTPPHPGAWQFQVWARETGSTLQYDLATTVSYTALASSRRSGG
jgi:hypothetical protein